MPGAGSRAAEAKTTFLVENVIGAPKPARAASTVMLVRDGAQGIEVLLTRRSSKSSFVPDAYVFPGGAVDAADGTPEMTALLNARLRAPAFTVAAVRELFEEAGILLVVTEDGARAALDAARLREMRAALLGGVSFAGLLRQARLRVDAANVLPYSNWITPLEEPKRFDTHFFAALAPGDQIAEADGSEVHDGRWFEPAAALARAQAGELSIIFPTRKHLERIAAHSGASSFLAAARSRAIKPVLAVSLGGNEFGLPADAGEW